MLTQPDFVKVYRAQDLYFFDPTDQVLVPDAVFVPAGTSPTSLVGNLVNALLKNPQPKWLQGQGSSSPAVTAFPPHTKLGTVTVDGSTGDRRLRRRRRERHVRAAPGDGHPAGVDPDRAGRESRRASRARRTSRRSRWRSTASRGRRPPPPARPPAGRVRARRRSCSCTGARIPTRPPRRRRSTTPPTGSAFTRCAPQSQVMARQRGPWSSPSSARRARPRSSRPRQDSVPASTAGRAAFPDASGASADHGRRVTRRQVPGRVLDRGELPHRVVRGPGQATIRPRRPCQASPRSAGIAGTTCGWPRATPPRSCRLIRRQQTHVDHEQLPREDPRPRHRPGRCPGRRHRAGRVGATRGGARGHRQRRAARGPAIRPVRPDVHRGDRATRP